MLHSPRFPLSREARGLWFTSVDTEKQYLIWQTDEETYCNCPDFHYRAYKTPGYQCKHIKLYFEQQRLLIDLRQSPAGRSA